MATTMILKRMDFFSSICIACSCSCCQLQCKSPSRNEVSKHLLDLHSPILSAIVCIHAFSNSVLMSLEMTSYMATEDHKTNASLYKALSERDDAEVIRVCQTLADGPLHILTIHGDSVVHLAIWYKHADLVLQLLNLLNEAESHKLTLKNAAGNTLLHGTATNNSSIKAAKELLRRAPSLLCMINDRGETALFRAARYGKTEIYKFLKEQVSMIVQTEDDLRALHRRKNKDTIFHEAINSENFDLACDIADNNTYLIGMQNEDGMTGLQLLASRPSAFDSGFEDHFFTRMIYKFVDPSPNRRSSKVPFLQEVYKQKLKSESAKKLANLLVEKDDSWAVTRPISGQTRSIVNNSNHGEHIVTTESEISRDVSHSTLFLATISGCTHVVEKILEMYPQAVEHIDEEGCNILHIAIKYRRMEIYQTVINMKYPLTRLRGKINKQGNSILHMVGLKVIDKKVEGDIRSPALILREDLLLYESVQEVCTTLATLQINIKGQTAEQLFYENNEQLRIDAKQWMRSTAEHCTIVAVLIATVAFAAAYTIPGGPNQQTGYPLLKSKPYFIIFALSDALSLTFALTSVIIFLSILTSSFRLRDFKNHLHNKLLLGLTMLILSVSMMMVAFAATLILTISSKQHWTNIIMYTISFLPVTVFLVSYVRLYTRLVKAVVESLGKNIALLLPTRVVESPQTNQQSRQPSRAPNTSSFV